MACRDWHTKGHYFGNICDSRKASCGPTGPHSFEETRLKRVQLAETLFLLFLAGGPFARGGIGGTRTTARRGRWFGTVLNLVHLGWRRSRGSGRVRIDFEFIGIGS